MDDVVRATLEQIRDEAARCYTVMGGDIDKAKGRFSFPLIYRLANSVLVEHTSEERRNQSRRWCQQ